MRKRKIAARALVTSRFHHVLYTLRAWFVSEVPILAYHRVLNIEDRAQFPFDFDLISATTNDFKWQMEYVKKHYTPIHFHDLIDYIDGGARLPTRPIIVTFDDGFDDNYHNAFSILKVLKVPATLFISTGYIGQERTFWFDWLAHLLLCVEESEIEISELELHLTLGSNHESRRAAFRVLVEALKRAPNQQRLDVLNAMESKYGAGDQEASEKIRKVSKPLDWDQVREMADHDIEFGSHAVTHPILTRLNDDELQFELTQSKHVLEAMLGRAVKVLAYPNGLRDDFDKRVQDAARLAGYRLGVSYLDGTNRVGQFKFYEMKRLHVELDVDRYDFSSMLAIPEIFG